MVIYQIHEYGGAYEDSFDILRGTYFNKKNAQKKLHELTNEFGALMKQVEKCRKCSELSLREREKRSCFLGDDGYCENEPDYFSETDTTGYEIVTVETDDEPKLLLDAPKGAMEVL